MCRPCKSLRNSQPSCIIDGWVGGALKGEGGTRVPISKGGGNDGGDAGKVDDGVHGDEAGL